MIAVNPTQTRLGDLVHSGDPSAAAETIVISSMFHLPEAILPDTVPVHKFTDPLRRHFARCGKSQLQLFGAVDEGPVIRLALRKFHHSHDAIAVLMDEAYAIAPGLTDGIIAGAIAQIGGRR